MAVQKQGLNPIPLRAFRLEPLVKLLEEAELQVSVQAGQAFFQQMVLLKEAEQPQVEGLLREPQGLLEPFL